LPGNGFGVYVEKDPTVSTSSAVSVQSNSIAKFDRNGVLVVGMGITADVSGNTISGIGPGTGVNQFGVFLANGAVGLVTNNMISQGNCGAIDLDTCFTLRSEGVVLRSVGDGTVVDGNTISNVQSGIFVKGANNARIANNVIRNVDALDGIHVQGGTNSLFVGNRIYSVGPIGPYASANGEGCGLEEVPGTGAGNNVILGNTVSDAFCGVAFVSTDWVDAGVYANTLYSELNADNYPDGFPTYMEPSAKSDQSQTSSGFQQMRRFRESLK
jgi:parallel beta-helix repeat protein